MTGEIEKPLVAALQGAVQNRPPVWFMRQAGRYLPEYRETRSKAGDFLSLCYSPALATEVTLQPLRRYAFDAAILFADILLIPHALGQHLEFVEGEGPKLDPVRSGEDLARLDPGKLEKGLSPVLETVDRLRTALEPQTTLIGFAGAPWTVASYMIGGKGSAGLDGARLWATQNPELFKDLLDLIVDATDWYLGAQVEAGADVVQIFDSWAGGLPEEAFRAWCVGPTKTLVERLRQRYPDLPIIGFPRGCGPLYTEFFRETGVNAVSMDTGVPLDWAVKELQSLGTVQGNLDPMALVAGGSVLESAVRKRLDALGGKSYIFNLGHGIVPQTPPDHVAQVIDILHKWGQDRDSAAPRVQAG